jgi:hypothetical protein
MSTTTTAAAPKQEIVLLEPTNIAELQAERSELLADVERELPDEIVSPAEYQAVGELEERLNRFINRVEPVFDDHVSAAHKVWKTACSIRSLFVDGAKGLKTKCRRLRGAYEQKEEQARREEERRLAEAERQRQLARQKEEAKLLEKQGQKELAQAVRSQPVAAPSVTLPSNVPTLGAGVTNLRRNWTWRVAGCTDAFGGRKDAAARKRAAKLVPREYLTLDDAAITALVKSTKGTVKIPGIEIFEEKV